MATCAPVPKACPQRAHGHSKMSVPLCPMSLDMGTGKAHHQPNKTSGSVPQERKRLYRPAQPPSSPPIRRGRLRRVQAERFVPHRAEGFVAFNDGVEASVMLGPIMDALRLAERKGSMIDAELSDYGEGWIVTLIMAPSDQWDTLKIGHCESQGATAP